MGNKNNGASRVQKEIENRIGQAFEMAAMEIGYEIQSHYKSAIDDFYVWNNLNNPMLNSYDRTYSLYYGSEFATKPSKAYKMYSNGYFQAGIRASSLFYKNATDPNPYADDTEYVYLGAFVKGIHGTSETGGVQSPSPRAIMSTWFDTFRTSGLKPIVDKYLYSYIDKRKFSTLKEVKRNVTKKSNQMKNSLKFPQRNPMKKDK